MLPRPAAGLFIMRPPVAWRSSAALIAILLSGCSSTPIPSAPSGEQAGGPTEAVTGVCSALTALPDEAAAARAFTNLAHEPLHRLAADPRLSRATSAGILEAMQIVEADLDRSAAADTLAVDLEALRAAAGEGLRALGEAVPDCA